jgi:hypothetical protein
MVDSNPPTAINWLTDPTVVIKYTRDSNPPTTVDWIADPTVVTIKEGNLVE